MRKVLSANTPHIDIEKVTDQMLIGIVKDGEKYIVVSKKSNNKYAYFRMNDNFHILWEEWPSARNLLFNVTYTEAFVFDTKKEMLHWLLN